MSLVLKNADVRSTRRSQMIIRAAKKNCEKKKKILLYLFKLFFDENTEPQVKQRYFFTSLEHFFTLLGHGFDSIDFRWIVSLMTGSG